MQSIYYDQVVVFKSTQESLLHAAKTLATDNGGHVLVEQKGMLIIEGLSENKALAMSRIVQRKAQEGVK